tara:strand:- start:6027 stop:10805 length:4779 start_codon:yes stop_codon:yes gene_type:complete
MEVMHVIKRDNSRETVSFDKIANRFKKLIDGDSTKKPLKVDPFSLTQKICGEMYSGVHTHELDELAAQTCASLITDCADFGVLASRLAISNHHKKTSPSFSETIQQLYHSVSSQGKDVQLITKELYNTVMKHKLKFNQIIDYTRDYNFDYFGFKTLEKSYLMKVNGNIVERPQHLLLRVALGIYGSDVKSAIECYNALSNKKYIHATPTLFNAGTMNGQLASCFLMGINDDSIIGIYDSLKDTALISKSSGGIGIHIHNIRSRGSSIGGGTGTSSGIVPMLRVFNNTAKYVDQCVVPETIIYTTEGPMEIQNVVAGETKIYNSSGYVETIGDVLEHPYEGIIYEVETMHSIDMLKITDEHPILVVPNQKKGLNSDVIRNRLDKKLVNMEFKEVKNLEDDDMIVYSIPKYEHDNEMITNDDCYFYGILLGDGSLQNNKTYGYISLNKTTKNHILEFCKSYFQNHYVEYHIEETESENCVRIRWNKSVDLKFRYSDVYNVNKEKYIHKNWLNLPINKAKYIAKGLIDTDGCCSGNNRPQELCFDSTSKMLMEGLRFILLRLGILTSGSIRDRVGESHSTGRGLIMNQKVSYVLRIPKTKEVSELLGLEEVGQFFKFLKYTDKKGNDYLMTRIKNITKTFYSGTLYDLQMRDKHEYMLHQGIVHNGGGKRNGSFAIYLEPWHADISEFLNLRKNQGFEENRARDLFYALWIPDLFMERVRDGGDWTLMCPHICPGLSDVYGDEFVKKYTDYEKAGLGTSLPARELWFQILESQVETGTPYILFKDSCNRKSNQKNLGTIKSSNLCCVTPDTKILTKKGYYNINELENQDVEVWNGNSWSATRPMKTGDNKKVLTVKFSNNMEIKCTEYHKFYIEESLRPADKTKPVVVEAKDLCPGMRVIRYSIEMGEQSSIEMKYPYTSGLFSADGTYAVHNETPKRCSFKCKEGENFCKRHLNNNNSVYNDDSDVCSANSYETRPLLYLYGKKKSLLSHVSYKRITENSERINLELPIDIDDKYKVPINYSLNTKLRWLEGLFDGDGCVVENNGIKNLQLGSIHKKFLDDVFFLLQTLGIVSTISLAQPERMTNMPNGKNEYKEVKCKTFYRTNVDCENLIKLKKLGFSPKRLDIDNIRYPHHKTNKFIKITEIQDNDEYSDTYCFNEPNEHKGIFNGILTGQCEIVEYSGPDETAVCNLASISLSSYVVKPDVPGNIVITGIDNCVYCKLAYSWCERWRLNFEYTKVIAENGKKYPIIEVKDDEKVIHSGGFTDFIEAYPVNYDHAELAEMTRQLTRNLNKVIDKSSYPIESARRSNTRHRPIGIGVQGLSDVFMRMRIPFDSEKAKKVNDKIFETIYYASMQESMRLAKKKHEKKKPNDSVKYPGAYSSFEGSPLEQGKFQFDLWEQQPSQEEPVYDWEELRNEIKTYGVLNSLVTCEMPTASSSQILGNNECIEPITSNIYVRRTLAGEFIVVNKYLQEDMEDLGIWNKELKEKILLHEGSVQNIPGIPQLLKDCYKTVWEMSQKVLIDLSADRGKYVCQSQSLNLFVAEPKFDVLTSMLLYTWSKGLKTGCYYLRTRPQSKAQQFSIAVQEPTCESCSA